MATASDDGKDDDKRRVATTMMPMIDSRGNHVPETAGISTAHLRSEAREGVGVIGADPGQQFDRHGNTMPCSAHHIAKAAASNDLAQLSIRTWWCGGLNTTCTRNTPAIQQLG